MPKQLYTPMKITGKETLAFSTAPDRGMFESRPVVVRSQAAQKSQPPDLKTSLMRAQRYGHRLHNIYLAGVSAPQAIQPKRTGGSSNVEIIQMGKRKSTASGTGGPAAKRPRNSYSIGQHGYKKT